MKPTLHIYTRVSSLLQQEDGTSLDSQRMLGIKKAGELDYDHKVWNEGGQSSFNDDLNNRPVMVALLGQIERGEVKNLFVYNTDRLSRNQRTWAVIRFKLLTHGVVLHTASGQMNLQNPVDDLMLGILSEISQYDNRIRAERCRIGRFHKIQQGNWKGGPPPYGYRLANKQLEVDPFESQWIRKIYDWYRMGVPVKSIQGKLAQEGVMTRRGNAQWSLGSINLVLRSTVYQGFYTYTDQMLNETVRIEAPRVIDPELMEGVIRRRALNKRQVQLDGNGNPKYLLRGLIHCGHCGKQLSGRSHNPAIQAIYYCAVHERNWVSRSDEHVKWKRGQNCKFARSINIGMTNQLVWDLMKTITQKILDHQPPEQDFIGPHDQSNIERRGLQLEQIIGVPVESIDTASEEQKRQVIEALTTSITATYDKQSNTHRLTVQWCAVVAGYIAGSQFDHQPFTLISPLAFTNGAGSSDSFTIATGTTGGSSLRSQNPTDFRSDWTLDDGGVNAVFAKV